ncbi:hypothetical protein BBJ28_00023294, partial [Nothophytophthora sp. Chile5]
PTQTPTPTQTEDPEVLAARAEQQAKEEAEKHAETVRMFPKGETQSRSLRCIGWRATADCNPHGAREPSGDFSCAKLIPNGHSGYCEVEDKSSGERFRVMRRHCNSLRYEAAFRCSDAADFAHYPLKARQAVDKALQPGFALPNVDQSASESREGIVMVVYPKLLASAYATIRVLRDDLDCRLPIEIWFLPKEMQKFPAALEPLRELAASDTNSEITFHEVRDPLAKEFRAKVFAIYHSFFDRVLFLDADNVPVRDPSFLFDSDEFKKTGAVFWPDFWHPTSTIFNIHSQSLLWELLDLPFANMFEQESGQLLVDRRRHAVPLELVHFYAFQHPNHLNRLKLAHGDKDLFRLAWLKQFEAFHMIQTPPAVAGKVISNSFCGMTMVQHDASGNVLFLHRNSHKLTGIPHLEAGDTRAKAVERARKKLVLKDPNGRLTPKFSEVQSELAAMATSPASTMEAPEPDGYPDPAIWTHLLSFRNGSRRVDYVIETYNADPEFPKAQNCYGQRNLTKSSHFHAQEVKDSSFSWLETHLRRYAMEAAQLHQKKLNVLLET